MNLRLATDPPRMPLNSSNGVLLSAEEHVLGAEKPETRFMGLPGASVGVASFAETFTRVSGINFVGAVSIASQASVIFSDCNFSLPVSMEAGAKAHFVGPFFGGTASVLNAGGAVNAYVIGSVRKSGVSHANVTVISETT
jgi:hypothetical protein